jgi:hypothetical protein
MDIQKAPKILRIDLKRFQSAGFFFGQKLDKFVDFPVEGLDISEFVSGTPEGPLIYDLYAIAVWPFCPSFSFSSTLLSSGHLHSTCPTYFQPPLADFPSTPS